MTRLSRVVIVAGAVAAFSARSEIRPAVAEAAPTAVAPGSLVALSAPTPSASCTVTPNADGYSVTVTWSGISVTHIDLLASGSPVAQTDLGHPTRNGSLTLTAPTAPNSAQISGRQGGLKVGCSST